MKLAVLSDIHGNIDALDAVLADMAALGIEQAVNLGDICSGPLFPRETAARLMPLDLPTVRGNHERQVLQPLDRVPRFDRYARASLEPAQLDWFASLPPTLRLGELLLVHATPGNDLDYYLETIEGNGIRAATPGEIAARSGDVFSRADPPAVILCGHTHIARSVRLANGALIVNPGSVGLPAYIDDEPVAHAVETGSPAARYAVLTRGEKDWSAELRAVDYDWRRAAGAAAAQGRPDIAGFLATGRARHGTGAVPDRSA